MKAPVDFNEIQKPPYELLCFIRCTVCDPQARCRSWFHILPSTGPRSHSSRILSLCVWCSASFTGSMMGWVSSSVPSPRPTPLTRSLYMTPWICWSAWDKSARCSSFRWAQRKRDSWFKALGGYLIFFCSHFAAGNVMWPLWSKSLRQYFFLVFCRNIMSNKVFYQHPNLMRALGMHETVMEVMVNVLGGGDSKVSIFVLLPIFSVYW